MKIRRDLAEPAIAPLPQNLSSPTWPSHHPGGVEPLTRDAPGRRADPGPRSERHARQDHPLDAWLADPGVDNLGSVVRHAVRLRRIDVLERLWDLLRSGPTGLPAAAAHELVLIPEEMRACSPRLTLLAAEAAAVLNGQEPDLLRMVSYVVRDASVHGHRWLESEDPLRTLWGGVSLMMAQRQIPAGHALLAARETQSRLDRSVKQFRSAGLRLDPQLVRVFHACAALLALAEADLQAAAAESGFAELLQPWPAARCLAAGARDVAASFSGQALPQTDLATEMAEQAAHRTPWSDALFATGLALSRLARAVQALNLLDRQEFERWLGQVSLAQAVGAGCWALHVYLTALHCRIWNGNLDGGLAELDAAVASSSLKSAESAEPFGRFLIAQARSLLLSGLGATEPALATMRDQPASGGGLGRAVASLNAGDLDGAIRHAEAALYDPACWFLDRASLMLVHAAARVMLPGVAPAERRRTAVTTLQMCARQDALLGLALLPAAARTALFDAYATARADDPGLDDLDAVLARLEQVVDIPDDRGPSIDLTRRERILLPMLASADSVPEIAKELHVSVNTVRKQVVTLRAKLGAHTRSELVRRARELGLLPSQGTGAGHG